MTLTQILKTKLAFLFLMKVCICKSSSPNDTIPVYGEMSLTVYTFFTRFPYQKDRNEISFQDEKKEKK